MFQLPAGGRQFQPGGSLLAVVLTVIALRVTSASADERMTFTKFAGPPGGWGSEDGSGTAARFARPRGLAAGADGSVYVADTENHTIRKISPDGAVSTLAGLAGVWGSADGHGSAARFRSPADVTVDGEGNVYVADSFNYAIRKITPDGDVTTLAGRPGSFGSADGAGADARFGTPTGVTVDGAGFVFVADTSNQTIRKISPEGVVTTLAGSAGELGSVDGTGSAARFRSPAGIVADGSGNLFVADTFNQAIRKITPSGVVTTLAGSFLMVGSSDGTGAAARFRYPTGITVDHNGDLFVADEENFTVRKVTQGGAVSTVAGLAGSTGATDGQGGGARFELPAGMAAAEGMLFVADKGNHTIRRIAPGNIVSTFGGLAGAEGTADGSGNAARFSGPAGMAVDKNGTVYVAQKTALGVRRITAQGQVTTLISEEMSNTTEFTAVDSAGTVYDSDYINGRIFKIASGVVSTFASQLGEVLGLATDAARNLYVADQAGHRILKITPGGTVTTLAGQAGTRGSADGMGTSARFSAPAGLAADAAGNIYVADQANHTIRKITPAGEVTTLAGVAGASGTTDGTGAAARLIVPYGVTVDAAGNLFVTSREEDTVRKITPAGVVTTIAGLPRHAGNSEGTGSAARMNPFGIAAGPDGKLYVSNSDAHVVFLGTVALPDGSTIDSGIGGVGSTRLLSTDPDTASAWEWSVIRRPAGSVALLSSTSTRSPTFTPDGEGLYTFRLRATDNGLTSITTVDLDARKSSRRRAVRH